MKAHGPLGSQQKANRFSPGHSVPSATIRFEVLKKESNGTLESVVSGNKSGVAEKARSPSGMGRNWPSPDSSRPGYLKTGGAILPSKSNLRVSAGRQETIGASEMKETSEIRPDS